MSTNKKNEIEKRKEQLENELQELESELDDNLLHARKDITNYLNPKKLVKEYPLQSVGVSILLGYLSGKSSNRNSAKSTKNTQEPTMVDLVWKEVKKDASKKLVKLLLSYLDKKTTEFTGQSKAPENGEKE